MGSFLWITMFTYLIRAYIFPTKEHKSVSRKMYLGSSTWSIQARVTLLRWKKTWCRRSMVSSACLEMKPTWLSCFWVLQKSGPKACFFLSRCALKIRFFGTLHDFSPEKMDASNSIYQNMIWGPSMAPSTLFSTWPAFTCKQIHWKGRAC